MEIRVRRGALEDVRDISRLMELNGLPRSPAAEEAFLVAEVEGEVLAALEYRFGERQILPGRFVADPFVAERPLAEALYREARGLARRVGLPKLAARPAVYGNFSQLAGYRRQRRGWALKMDEPPNRTAAGRVADSWRRVLVLWGRLPVPFFREVGG